MSEKERKRRKRKRKISDDNDEKIADNTIIRVRSVNFFPTVKNNMIFLPGYDIIINGSLKIDPRKRIDIL